VHIKRKRLGAVDGREAGKAQRQAHVQQATALTQNQNEGATKEIMHTCETHAAPLYRGHRRDACELKRRHTIAEGEEQRARC
jgi:hypothetical protein